VQAINREDHEYDEIGNHQRQVESVGVVHAGESLIRDPMPKVADGALRHEKNRE
jgi:hypothetical protein